MSGNLDSGGRARIRMLLALIAAEETAYAIVVLPNWTPGRAAVAAAGLALGVTASLLAIWRLGKGDLWPAAVAGVGIVGLLAQVFVLRNDAHVAAYVLLGLVAMLAVVPVINVDVRVWTTRRPVWLPVAAMLVAGLAFPPLAASMSDPTQVGPDSLQLSVSCETTPTADVELVTVTVHFRWLRTDLLPDGLAGEYKARDAVSVWAHQSDLLQEWLDAAPPWFSGSYPLNHVEINPSIWRPAGDPFEPAVDAALPRVPFGRADNWSSDRGLPQSEAQQLILDWNAIEAGRTYSEKWTFLADPGTAPAFVEVEYNHLLRMTFQAGADCAHPSTVYPTRYYVNRS